MLIWSAGVNQSSSSVQLKQVTESDDTRTVRETTCGFNPTNKACWGRQMGSREAARFENLFSDIGAWAWYGPEVVYGRQFQMYTTIMVYVALSAVETAQRILRRPFPYFLFFPSLDLVLWVKCTLLSEELAGNDGSRRARPRMWNTQAWAAAGNFTPYFPIGWINLP
jgi:hypothetical protein